MNERMKMDPSSLFNLMLMETSHTVTVQYRQHNKELTLVIHEDLDDQHQQYQERAGETKSSRSICFDFYIYYIFLLIISSALETLGLVWIS